MIARWVYMQAGRLIGPLTAEDLKATAFLGFLKPSDLVRDETTLHWLEARAISELEASFAAPSGSQPGRPKTADGGH